ncbi:MAG: hypothetical protein KIT33_00560 [Candidatus Kapabacteria bacterium]|nr:hypothetical protein [Ignavibacteriota bacterium]MCW5883439.1 hypothetical protein [Candidatus Kapabacteria bacterium]
MKSTFKILLLVILSLVFAGCPEDGVSPIADEILAEKSLSPSSELQTVISTNDIQVLIPGGSLETNLEITVSKITNPPGFNIDGVVLGKNIYKISMSGKFLSNKYYTVIIKYDKSKVKAGQNPADIVHGAVFNGNWMQGDYTLNTNSGEILFDYYPNDDGKSTGDLPRLQNDDEVIFGDAYTTTDTGDSDDLLALLKYLHGNIQIYDYEDDDISFNFGNYVSKSPLITWNKNSFTLTSKLIPTGSHTGYENKLTTTISGDFTPSKLDAWDWKVKNLTILVDGTMESNNKIEYHQYTIKFNDLSDGWYHRLTNGAMLQYSYQLGKVKTEMINTFDIQIVYHDFTDPNNEKWFERKLFKSDINFGSDYNILTLNFYENATQ